MFAVESTWRFLGINGIMLTFHDRGAIHVVATDGMILQPGLFSDFKIRVKRRKRLPTPYGGWVVLEKEIDLSQRDPIRKWCVFRYADMWWCGIYVDVLTIVISWMYWHEVGNLFAWNLTEAEIVYVNNGNAYNMRVKSTQSTAPTNIYCLVKKLQWMKR